MATFIESRIAELESAMPETETLAGVYRAIDFIKNTLADIKQYAREHIFPDRAEEINYFKLLAPPVYGRLFYFMKVAEVGIEALHSNEERMEAFLNLELAKTEQFFFKHAEFCQYYHQGQTFMDDRIFIRDPRENSMLDCVEVFMAEDFCVGCYWAALLWANRELKPYYHERLRKLKQPECGSGSAEALPVLEWTDSQTDLVELIYALYVKGSFNNGKAKLKEIAAWVEAHLNTDVGNYYNTIKEIGNRKKGQVKYLDDLRDRALRRLDERN
jgi:hypothetical protein